MPHKDNKPRSVFYHAKRIIFHASLASIIIISLCIILLVSYLFFLDREYQNKIYPRVYIGNDAVGGKTEQQIVKEWERKNTPYKNAIFELQLDGFIATVSGKELQLGYDSTLLARQAYLVGRSGKILSDIYTKLFKNKTIITAYFRWDTTVLMDMLEPFAAKVNVPPENALFEFNQGKVTQFKPATPGKRLNKAVAQAQIERLFPEIPYANTPIFRIHLPVDHIQPDVATDETNNFGIRERIGTGYSQFSGSIPGRIHNIVLSAKKMHGVLVPPGEVISYNKLMGDISQATGWKTAYIIKDGRTVLGDGGGVCQGSTTLFRAALNAGLPIVERQPHAYRVHFYEDGGFKPGLDATVFAPSVDLKIQNDTPGHILIQAYADLNNFTLTVDLYGTSDGRKADILNHQILSQTPPPPPLYIDDPTLPKGVTKQVDWSAWGAKTVFTYKVIRGKEVLQNRQFVSNFRPWQAVYLVGTL
jgi:vancomycin resistance protein YoaR